MAKHPPERRYYVGARSAMVETNSDEVVIHDAEKGTHVLVRAYPGLINEKPDVLLEYGKSQVRLPVRAFIREIRKIIRRYEK